MSSNNVLFLHDTFVDGLSVGNANTMGQALSELFGWHTEEDARANAWITICGDSSEDTPPAYLPSFTEAPVNHMLYGEGETVPSFWSTAITPNTCIAVYKR